MSAFSIVRSIDLSSTTRSAWERAGGVFLRPDRTIESIFAYARHRGHRFVLNLGRSELSVQPLERGDEQTPPIPFINDGISVISRILTPGATRQFIPELIPPAPRSYPAAVWVKAPGRAGRGKFLETVSGPLQLPRSWDFQAHVNGDEYRVVTVGRRAVQGAARFGRNGDREYEWRGLQGTPELILGAARQAAQALNNDNAMIAWDLIHEIETDQAYILEGNSCPGVNNATAERVVNEIIRQIDEGRIS